jgi:dienelactone hydrolase
VHLRAVGNAGISVVAVVVLGAGLVACSSSGATLAGSAQPKSAAPVVTTAPTPWPSVVELPTQLPDKPTFEQVLPLFAYKGDQAFAVSEKSSETDNGATVKDITFIGAAGEPVDAYLILPAGNGPFPGILFEHVSGGSREDFLTEATTLAQTQHSVGLVVGRPTSAIAGDARTETVLQVREVRRALDFLASQAQVDSSRLAYVGHSLGAMYGLVTSAVDSRLKTAVFMSLVPSGANLVPDLALFAPHSAAGSTLFQFGRLDGLFTADEANAFAALVPGTKQVSWYDGGHGLTGAAQTDRDAWLAEKLAK